MSVKDCVTGTTKRLVAEIVGDGKLAQQGSRQAAAGPDASSNIEREDARDPEPIRPARQPAFGLSGNEERFAALLGRAALSIWADLPRGAQERLFAAAVDDGVIANDLAEFLHDRHPRTAHPPRPTRIA
jgi:hypothetical protein